MLPEHSLRVIIADDDQDDWYFADLAFKESGLDHKLDFVINGAELMERLENMHAAGGGLPDLILLDLNMPKKDGREALKEIRSDSRFSHLNVAIYSTTIGRIEDAQHDSNSDDKRDRVSRDRGGGRISPSIGT